MLKGLWFFCRFGWKADKRFIIYKVLPPLLSAVLAMVAVAMPKYIIDELMGAQRVGRLASYAGVLIGYTLVSACASNFFTLAGFTRRINVVNAFFRFMHRKLADADYANLESPAFWNMRKNADKFLRAEYYSFGYLLDRALDVMGQGITLVGMMTLILRFAPWFVGLIIALALLSTAADLWANKNEVALSLEQAQVERRSAYLSNLFEDPKYAKEICLYRLKDWLLSQESKDGNTMYGFYRRRNGFYIRSNAFGAWVVFLQQCAAYAFLIAQVISGAMAIGDFTMYVGAATAFFTALRGALHGVVEMRGFGVYYGALEEYMNIPDSMRKNRRRPVPQAPFAIEFRNVSFRYPGQEEYALKNVSITLRPGEKLAVVGENGAGKTTFIKLLMRLYDPDEGAIYLNGMDIRDISYEEYMGLFSTVFQDYQLFAFTLKENVTLGMEGSDEEVEAVLRRVGLGDRLDTLPRGIHTAIYKEFDENGFAPSGGEGQKIALARALFKDGPIVVLDEPAAALDPRAEYEMYMHFNELVAGKSAVYISHRLSSARFCNKVAVFSHGRLAEFGTHDALMEQDGLYAQLFSMQAHYYA